MNVLRCTIVDPEGAVSFVAHGDALPALVAGCASNPGSLLELLARAEPFYQNLSEERVRLAHRKALAVHAWTADQPPEMHRLAAAGVDGIVTNFPDRARSFLRSLEAAWPR